MIDPIEAHIRPIRPTSRFSDTGRTGGCSSVTAAIFRAPPAENAVAAAADRPPSGGAALLVGPRCRSRRAGEIVRPSPRASGRLTSILSRFTGWVVRCRNQGRRRRGWGPWSLPAGDRTEECIGSRRRSVPVGLGEEDRWTARSRGRWSSSAWMARTVPARRSATRSSRPPAGAPLSTSWWPIPRPPRGGGTRRSTPRMWRASGSTSSPGPTPSARRCAGRLQGSRTSRSPS